MLLHRTLALTCMLFLATASALAEQQSEKRAGEYTVYYSVFPSSFLLPAIASQVGITRGKDRSIVNISVRRGEGEASSAKAALVRGTSSDLVHKTELVFTEVREQGAIYYLAEIKNPSPTTLYFDLTVTPDPNAPAIDLQFKREVYPE